MKSSHIPKAATVNLSQAADLFYDGRYQFQTPMLVPNSAQTVNIGSTPSGRAVVIITDADSGLAHVARIG